MRLPIALHLDFWEDNVARQGAVELSVCVEFGICACEGNSESLGLLSLALTRVMRSRAIPLDALNAALLLLVVRLGSFPRWETRFWLGQFLTP